MLTFFSKIVPENGNYIHQSEGPDDMPAHLKTLLTQTNLTLSIKNKKLMRKAKRIRWFGIDREKKQKATWENDIFENVKYWFSGVYDNDIKKRRSLRVREKAFNGSVL